MPRQSSTAAALLAAALLAACSPSDSIAPPASSGVSLSETATTEEPYVLATAKSNETDPKHFDRTRFNITLKYVTEVTPEQRAVFEEAARRWEKIIVADVPSVTGTIPSAFQGQPPASSTIVDDVVIEVALQLIDGPGVPGRNVLGAAGPRFVRFVDGLPVSGVMFFDTYDLGLMATRGIFDEVIVHEMGHVLGIGTLWNLGAPFPVRQLRTGTAAAADYAFVGKHANQHWNAEGGVGLVPVANVGAAGSIGSHWRESVMTNELMTPSIGLGESPLSRITSASMRDLGYGIGTVGEQYALPRGAQGEVEANAATVAAGGVNIAESEELFAPVGVVMPE